MGAGGISPGAREKLASSLGKEKSKGGTGGAGTVVISDISSLLPVDYRLAKSYRYIYTYTCTCRGVL